MRRKGTMRHVPPATKLYKQAYPVATGLVRVRPLRPQRAHFTIEHSSTVIAPRNSKSRRSACELTQSKLLTFLSLITKLPLAPKRELLAIHKGGVTNYRQKKKDHIGLRFRLAAVSANLIECRITQSIKCRIT